MFEAISGQIEAELKVVSKLGQYDEATKYRQHLNQVRADFE